MMGVRWEYQTPWISFQPLAYFDPNVVEPLTQRKDYCASWAATATRYQSTPDKNNFAPVWAGVAVSQNTVCGSAMASSTTRAAAESDPARVTWELDF